MTLKPYLGAAKCIISTAQHARPNVIGHKEPCQKKISCHICCDGITQLHYVELEILQNAHSLCDMEETQYRACKKT